MYSETPNKQQEQSKKRKSKRWLQWLRKPQTIRLLFQLGPVIFKILKWLIEFWQD